MSCCNWNVAKQATALTLFVIGFVLMIISATIPPYIDREINSAVIDNVILTEKAVENGDSVYRTFVDPEDEDSSPIYKYIYVLHITNPNQFAAGTDSKPVYEEKGPFVYRRLIRREELEFRDASGHRVVRFKPRTTYRFEAELSSEATDEISVTVPNTQFFGAYALWKATGSTAGILQFAAAPTDRYRMFKDITVREYAADYLGLTRDTSTNNLYDEWYTGEGNTGLAGTYRSWKEQGIATGAAGPAFEHTQAQSLLGTDGARFHPFLDKCEKTQVSAFVTEVGRIVPLSCRGEFKYKGITMYELRLDDAALPAGGDNAIYEMAITGAFNVTRLNGVPMVMTKPHGLDCPYIGAYTSGLTPSRDLHDIVLGVEPLSGMVMYARKRLQVNLLTMGPFEVDGNEFMQNVPQGIPLPAVWVSEQGEIPDSRADDFVKSVYGAQNASKYLLSVGLSIGSILVFFSFAFYVWERSRLSSEGEISRSSHNAIELSRSSGSTDGRDTQSPVVEV